MATLSANEHWLVMQGGLEVELEGRVGPTRLAEQDGPQQSKQSLHHAFACRIHFEPFTVCLQWRCCGKGRRGEYGRAGRRGLSWRGREETQRRRGFEAGMTDA